MPWSRIAPRNMPPSAGHGHRALDRRPDPDGHGPVRGMTRDAPNDQQRLNRDQCSQPIIAVREQRFEEALLLGGLRDPKKAAGNLKPPAATRPECYRDVDIVRGIQQASQELSTLLGIKRVA